MNKIVEIRSYNLRPQSRERIARIAGEEVMPMLARVGHGPSAHDEDTCFLIRAYASLDHRRLVPAA